MPQRRGLDHTLVESAQAGDEKARAQLLSRIQPILRAFFVNRIGHKPEVDDLVQNTLVRVHTGLTDLKNPSRLKSFAMKAAIFELHDLYRGRYSGKELLFDPDHPPEHPAGAGSAGAAVDLQRALDALSPKARRIIELREYGYRYEEIAAIVGSTEAAIKMQVKRAFEKMKSSLAGLLALLPLFQ
jgi:RNA polymerase sigma-70 factor, ECF subfamily